MRVDTPETLTRAIRAQIIPGATLYARIRPLIEGIEAVEAFGLV